MIEREKKRSFMSFNSNDFKGFTFRSGPVKNQVKQNSSFWWNDNDDTDVDEFLGVDVEEEYGGICDSIETEREETCKTDDCQRIIFIYI